MKLVSSDTITLLAYFRAHASSRDLVMTMTRSGCQHCADEFGNILIIRIMIIIDHCGFTSLWLVSSIVQQGELCIASVQDCSGNLVSPIGVRNHSYIKIDVAPNVGSSSQAHRLVRNSAMDDSIGGS